VGWQRRIAARQVARDNDVGWRRAVIQQALDGSIRLAKPGREELFRCEGYGQIRDMNAIFSQKTHRD